MLNITTVLTDQATTIQQKWQTFSTVSLQRRSPAQVTCQAFWKLCCSLTTAAPEFKCSSTMGGISLSGNAVIHQLTINFTRTESEPSDIASKQHLPCQIRKPLPEENDVQSQPLEPEIA